MSWKAKRYRRRRNRHHLRPKARGGTKEPSNLLLLKVERHTEWHKIFGLSDLQEIIALLQRVQRMKERQSSAVIG
jgi:hypothetical protein